MPKFTVDQSSTKNPQEAFSQVKSFLENDEDLRKLDSNLSCDFDEAQMTAQAKGSQFKADLQVEAEGAGSRVSVHVDIPFLLTPFKGKIQEILQKKLQKVLGPA